jgi:hypothetical protein
MERDMSPARLNEVAKAADLALPDGYGFVILAMPLTREEDRAALPTNFCQYVSNVKRGDGWRMLRDFVASTRGNPDYNVEALDEPESVKAQDLFDVVHGQTDRGELARIDGAAARVAADIVQAIGLEFNGRVLEVALG